MGAPSFPTRPLRRPIAALLALVCALESGVLPAAAALAPEVRPAASPAPSGTFGAWRDALFPKGLFSALPTPSSVAASAAGAVVSPSSALAAELVPGLTAGRAREAGRRWAASIPASRREAARIWLKQSWDTELNGLADSAALSDEVLARLRSRLNGPSSERSSTLMSLPTAALLAAQEAAQARIARLALPDFFSSRRAPQAAVPASVSRGPAALPRRAPSASEERLSQKTEMTSGASNAGELSELDRLTRRVEGELTPAEPGPSGYDDARDARWADLEALKRVFDAGSAGARPASPASPVPPEKAGPIAGHVGRIERLKNELAADLARRDAADAVLAADAAARDEALARRRSGKDEREFRKNFSRVAMVMDLSYSLNLLNNADQALARMQALIDRKIQSVSVQRASNDADAGAAAVQAADVAQWQQQARDQAAADHQQSTSFSSLGGGLAKLAAAVQGFRTDVPSLLAMIDARDKGGSASSVAEYDRRLALLPMIVETLKTGAADPSSGVGSMSLASLQAKSREVAADRALLAGADAKISAAPIEFAGLLVVAVPGVPSESVSNPTPDQMLALLARRRAFWKAQYDEEAGLLASVQAAMDPSNAATTTDSFGWPQPASLAAWRAQAQSRDARLVAAETPMLAQADADEAAIESPGGARLTRLSGLSPEDMRVALPRVLDQLSALRLPDNDAGFAAKAASIDLSRLVCFLGDATAGRLEARATAAALDAPVNVILPKARDAFKTATAAWRAVLDDAALDEAYVRAGAPASQAAALIARKRALVSGTIAPALSALQDLLDGTLIPFQNQRLAQADPANSGDGYATLYAEKKKLYLQIADGLRSVLPWALASDGAPAYDAGAARLSLAGLRKTYDQYRGVIADDQDQMRRRVDPNEAGTEDVYGEQAPYSLVKRAAVYQAEKNARAAALNAAAAQIDDILGKMDALDGGKHALLTTWRLPTDLDPNSPSTTDRLHAMVTGNNLQNMAAAIKAVADAAQAAGGAPSVSVGGGATIPVGTQAPIDVTPQQKLALYGLEAVKRLVPGTQSGAAGDSYAHSLARFLFADAMVSSSKTYLTQRILLFNAYLAKAKAALDGAASDLDLDLAWVGGDRAGGEAVLARKAALFSGLAGILDEGAGLFDQKAGWDNEGLASAVQAGTYYNALQQTYLSGNQALDAELTAAREYQDALAQARAKIDAQRAEVVGWLRQLDDPRESAMSRVAQNLSSLQDRTREVLEKNVAARRAQRERDEAAAAVAARLKALAAEESALDESLTGVGDLARLGPELAGRVRGAVGSGGAWIAESPDGPQALVVARSQLETFLGRLFGAASAAGATPDLAALRESILKDPTALARLIPGSQVVSVGQGPDGFYLVYQTDFSTPGGLETSQQATLGNIAKLWGQNVSLVGYRFASPPSAGNAPFGDQGVTAQIESLDSDHAVNYLDVTFHKFLQDIPSDLSVAGQAREARMMVFDDFALLVADGKVYFGAAGFADRAASDAAEKPSYYGGTAKTSVKFTQVLSLNAAETDLFAKDPRKFLQTVNLDFTKYDPTLDQNFIISGSGQNKSYRRDQAGVGVDLGQALGQRDSFMLDFYYARTSGTDDVTQDAAGVKILKGFTFDLLGQKAVVTAGGGAEAGPKQDDFNGRVSFELPDQGFAVSAQGKLLGTGSAYFTEVRKKLGDHSSAAVSYGSPYIGLNNRAAVSFSSSYTLSELWRAVAGRAAADLSGGRSLADFDKSLSDFFTRGASDPALAELQRVFDADVGRRLTALEIGRLSREISDLTKAGALLDNTRQSAMVGFVSNAIGPGAAEAATGGGFQVGTRTDLTLTKTQRELIAAKTATLYALGLDLEERLLELAKSWQEALADLAQARWRELLAAWLAARVDDPVLLAEAESDAAAAADARRQAELRYASLTGRGPEEIPSFDGVSPRDFDALLAQVNRALSGSDRLGALIRRAGGGLDVPKAGFNVLDWIPWVEKLTFTVGAQLPDILSSQALGAGVRVTLPVYDPARGRNAAALVLQTQAAALEMAARRRQTRLRAHEERFSARAWAARAAETSALEARVARELSDGIRQSRNALIEPSELRARARRWRDTVAAALEARTRASLEDAWAALDDEPGSDAPASSAEPADMNAAFDQAAGAAPDWQALALRSQAARELMASADRRVGEADLDVGFGANMTALGAAFFPVFGVTGLGVVPVPEVTLTPEELRQLDVRRTGEEANLYSRLRDKAGADAALSLTQAALDAGFLDQEIALYRRELVPQLERSQDGSSQKVLDLARARGALADLESRRGQTGAAMNQLLGRPLGAPLAFAPSAEQALAALAHRDRTADPVAAARDTLESRVKIARAVETAVDKNLRVDKLRLEPVSMIGVSLGRLVSALSGDAAGSPELMALARERTLEAERALESFDEQVPAAVARLTARLSEVRAARAALSGDKAPASRLQDLELARQEAQLTAQLTAWGGKPALSADGAFPSSYADLEDRLRRAAEAAGAPSPTPDDAGAIASPAAVETSASLRGYDARRTLGGDPIGRRFVEGWVEARLRSPATTPEALAALAQLREDAADERRRLDAASADSRAELLLARLRLGAGLARWAEGAGLGDAARARLSGDLAEAAALLHLPPDVRPERLMALLPASGEGDLSAVADAALREAEALDLEALKRTLFEQGLPREMQDGAGRDGVPELRADLIAERMSSRGFTPVAAFGLFKGQWVSGAFLEAPRPDQIQSALGEIVDDALRRELESRDRLKSLGLLLHALMASVSDKTRLAAAARLREVLSRRALRGALERVRLRAAPASEAAEAAAEAQAAQEDFIAALYALREDFARLTTELTALGVHPASLSAPVASGPSADEPLERAPREKLLAYWADRMRDPAFAARVDALLADEPQDVRDRLRDLSARYRRAVSDAEAVRTEDFTPAERLDLLTKTDVQGRRRAIEEVLGRVLDDLQKDDAARAPRWTALMGFLREDVSARAASASGDLRGGDAQRRELRRAFIGALNAPPDVRAEIGRLEGLQARADSARRAALASWLSREDSARDHVLKDRALDAYVSALDAFDAEMQSALSLSAVAQDAGFARSLDALYDARASLRRRRDRLERGRGLLTLDAAVSLDEARVRALRWSPDDTREIAPASESLSYLRGLREQWTGRPDSLPALVGLRGGDGSLEWTTADELARARAERRVVAISGRRFLKPADGVGADPKDASAALAQGWREIVEGADAERERRRQEKESRAAAAREAALARLLETAEVAVSGDAAGRGGAMRAMTLGDLRAAEREGRALWFEAAADPRTGLRPAVPASAARWRDPAELVLEVLRPGEVPPSSPFPTLEVLLASSDAARFAQGRIGAAGLRALSREAAEAALAARRDGWLKLKLGAWGFAVDAAGDVQDVYRNEDELRKAADAALVPKDPGHGWTFLRTDAIVLGLAADGTLIAVKAGARTLVLGDGTPARWVSQDALALETDAAGRVVRLFTDPRELDRAAKDWSLRDAEGRTWTGGKSLPPLLRARRWVDPSSGLTVTLGRELLEKRREAAAAGKKDAAHWGYAPARWPGLLTEPPRGVVSTPLEIVTGRDPNQQGYLGRINARRGEGGAEPARGAIGSVFHSIDLFGLMNDPVDRYFDPSQYPASVDADGKRVFLGVGSYAREERWADQDLSAARNEILADFRGGVRRETLETVRGRGGDYADLSLQVDVGRGEALKAIDEFRGRLDADGAGRMAATPRRGAVDRVDADVQVIAGAAIQDERRAVYAAALERLRRAPAAAVTDAEVSRAETALSTGLAARRAADEAVAAASPIPNLPGCPVVPRLYSRVSL